MKTLGTLLHTHQRVLYQTACEWKHVLNALRPLTTKHVSPLIKSSRNQDVKKLNQHNNSDDFVPEYDGSSTVMSPKYKRSNVSRKSAPWIISELDKVSKNNPSQQRVKAEFKNLSNDDFSKENRKSTKDRSLIKRSNGSEILFGVAPCHLALKQSRRNILQLFLKSTRSHQRPEIQGIWQKAEAVGLPVQFVSRRLLDNICEGRVHQGVCLETTPLRYSDYLENKDIDENKHVLYLALDGIHDPMNLGAVLRSAYYLGVDKVIISKKNSCPLTPVVSKASAGVMEVFEVFGTDDLQSFLQAKKDKGWKIIGTVKPSEDVCEIPICSVFSYQMAAPSVLLLGNEGHGLPAELRSLCSNLLTIPSARVLHPGMDSLNVSVAAGILLHSLCSQRVGHPPVV
ncbi:LOW QUALITY PROTEIN: rRNA methyltransferase 1, mitochondrial [Discoglossus pictus]